MAFKEGYENEIFESCTLLGSRILTEEEKAVFDDAAFKTIWRLQQGTSVLAIPTSERRMTVLSIVNTLKTAQDKSIKFWEFISSRYDFKKFDQTTESALRDLIYYTMARETNKIFFESKKGKRKNIRLVMSTLYMHAFSPKEQWFDILDLVEGLFCEDLNYTYSEDDPRLNSLFTRLFNAFPLASAVEVSGEDENSDAIERIYTDARSYSVYCSFQRLALEENDCAVSLLKDMLRRIAILYDGRQLSEDTYEDLLCREWSERDGKERKKPASKDDIATTFQPRFRLKNGRCVEIFISDTYLEQSDFDSLKYIVYFGGEKKIEEYTGKYRKGFTWVMKGFSIPLRNLASESDFKSVRLEIYADDEIIFDSEKDPRKSLCREYFVFSSKGEEKRKLSLGIYILVVPEDADLLGDSENVLVSCDDRFNQPTLAAYDVELFEGYKLLLDGKEISSDWDRNKDVRVYRPAGPCLPIDSLFVKEDKEYKLVSSGRSIVIEAKNEAVKNLRIEKNGRYVGLAGIKGVRGDTKTMYELPMRGFDEAVISYSGQRFRFLSVEDARYSFDRSFYFLPEDYESAEFKTDLDGLVFSTSFSPSDFDVSVPDGRLGGKFLVPIPKIKLHEPRRLMLDEKRSALYLEDIPQSARLEVTMPRDVREDCPDVCVRMGDSKFSFDKKGALEIGNAIYSRLGEGDRQDVEIVATWPDEDKTERSYVLKTVFYKDGFLNPPTVTYGDDALHIEGMEGFVGDAKSGLRIDFWKSVEQNRKNSISFDFSRDTREISVGKLDDGYYSYEIVSVSSRGEDGCRERKIACANFQTGDEDEYRFKNKRVVVKPNVERKYSYGEIRCGYIDSPEFKGRESTASGVHPIYEGTLYELSGSNDARYVFSDRKRTDKSGEKIYRVNPVKIICLGEDKLSIATADSEPIYYIAEGYGPDCVAKITDKAPNAVTEERCRAVDFFDYVAKKIKG